MSGRRYGVFVVLAVTGIIGFRIGFVEFPTWQVAVETAQVVAGIVKYPAGNPFYIYHTKLWTVLHQVCAILLRAGMSEITLSKLVSGLLGMVSFQALGVLAYAFSQDALVSIGAPFLIFYARAAEHGTVYPISLLGSEHTYGVLGLSFIVLVVALLGAGCYRLGGFLLGVAPAVHPSWGAWLMLIATLAFLSDVKRLSREMRPALRYFIAGCMVTGLSLLVQLTVTYDVPKIDPAVATHYLDGFVKVWDFHRRPAPFVSVGMILNIDVLVIALVWLRAFADDLPRPAVFALRAITISAALSLPLLFVSWLSPEKVPSALLVLMPSRFLNFNTLAFVSVLLGLLGVYRNRFSSQVVTAALLGGLFFSYRSMLWDGRPDGGTFIQQIQFNPWHVFVTISIGLVFVGLLFAWDAHRARKAASIEQPAASTSMLTKTARGVALAFLALSAVLTWRLSDPETFRDRTNDSFFAAIAAEPKGMLLTAGSFHLVQLRTRRPVLLDGGGLDALPYAPEGGPEMERIFREVYGVDFFNPPGEAQGGGVMPSGINKPIWERYSRQKWMEIKRAFNVTEVLTAAVWSLDLPVAAEDEGLRLYHIPD